VLRNRGEYDASGKMTCAMPMTYDEFLHGAKEDELKTVFLNGKVVEEQTWWDVRLRAKVNSVDGAMTNALNNLAQKTAFLQRATEPEPMCVRLAEAACGSKWMYGHPTTLKTMKAKFPMYAKTFDSLGLKESMDSVELVETLKSKYVCSKKECKGALAAIADGETDAALKKMGGKIVLTL